MKVAQEWRDAAHDMARLQARRSFDMAKRECLSLFSRHGESPRWGLATMRNAWVAFHATDLGRA